MNASIADALASVKKENEKMPNNSNLNSVLNFKMLPNLDFYVLKNSAFAHSIFEVRDLLQMIENDEI